MVNKYIFLLFCSVLIASFSQILLKKSAKITYKNHLEEYLNPYVIIGYGMMVVSTVLTILAYSHVAYKNGPVVEALGYILIMILSYLFFKEKITVKKVIGNILILIGIAVFYM